MKNFLMIQKLGDGQFGNVFLVKDVVSDKNFALKCISLQQIKEETIETHILVISALILAERA